MNKRKRNEQTKYQAEKEKAFKGWAYYTDMKRNDVLGLVWEEEEKEEEKIQDYIELPPRSYITPDLYKEGVILKKKKKRATQTQNCHFGKAENFVLTLW